MKAKKFIASILVSTIMLGACAAPKQSNTASPARAGSSDAVVWNETSKGAEHCLAADKATCFLEIDTDGKSQFFATGESYTKLLVDPILAEIHIDLKPTDADAYQKMKTDSNAKVVYEGPESNAANVYSDKVDESANFIFLIFRIVSFLWKASGYVDTAVTLGGIASKIGKKLSSFKDKLKAKLGIGKDAAGAQADGSNNAASDITARITWHLDQSAAQPTVTKELPIPAEYVTVTAAEKKAAEEAAAEVEAEIKAEEAAAAAAPAE